MKVRFLGNGLRIKNVLKCVTSNCSYRIYHLKSKQFCSDMSYDVILDFMISHGFRDVFYLEISDFDCEVEK